MMGPIITAIVWVIVNIIEQSTIQSLGQPYIWFPLSLIIGVIIMHRFDDWIGALFILLSAISALLSGNLSAAIGFLLSAIIGQFMVVRLFAVRSLYALLGLGLALNAIFTLSVFFFKLEFSISELLWRSLWVVLGLYFGLTGVRLVERNFQMKHRL